MKIFIFYILPAILTFYLIRKVVKEDDYNVWTNKTMIFAILLSLLPIINWIGGILYLIVKFLETESGKKLCRWLEQDSF